VWIETPMLCVRHTAGAIVGESKKKGG